MLKPDQGGTGFRTKHVVIILAILVVVLVALGVLLPALAARRETPHANHCMSNIKQIAYACQLYAGENRFRFPSSLGALFPHYISDPSIFVCGGRRHAMLFAPYDGPKVGPLPEESTVYCYVAGLREEDPADTILAFAEEWCHGGESTYVLCVGGQVTWESDLDALHARLAAQAKKFRAAGRKVKLIRPPWSRWPERPDLSGVQTRRSGGIKIKIEYAVLIALVLVALGLAAIVSLRLLRSRA